MKTNFTIELLIASDKEALVYENFPENSIIQDQLQVESLEAFSEQGFSGTDALVKLIEISLSWSGAITVSVLSSIIFEKVKNIPSIKLWIGGKETDKDINKIIEEVKKILENGKA